MTIDNIKSPLKSVLSGVPQGSILGPILFVLFINDLPQGVDSLTNISLYADDTKMWRKVSCDNDVAQLQKDIDYLHKWSEVNLMSFHPKKCKVVSVNNKPSPLSMLPFVSVHYLLGENFLSYADSERDLGVEINSKFSFNEHCEQLLTKANQQYGLLRRTCHFVNDTKRRRVLYLTLVRSQFEHCSQVWHPTSKTMLSKFESFQKKCIKWVLFEEELSYHARNTYLKKCKEINVLPMQYKFDLSDAVLFHKIVYSHIPIEMPDFLVKFNGNSRLRSSHLDRLSYVSSILPRGLSTKNLQKSFFYRTHSLWNSLPLEIREISSLCEFKSKVSKYFWKLVSDELNTDMDIDDRSGVT